MTVCRGISPVCSAHSRGYSAREQNLQTLFLTTHMSNFEDLFSTRCKLTLAGLGYQVQPASVLFLIAK